MELLAERGECDPAAPGFGAIASSPPSPGRCSGLTGSFWVPGSGPAARQVRRIEIILAGNPDQCEQGIATGIGKRGA